MSAPDYLGWASVWRLDHTHGNVLVAAAQATLNPPDSVPDEPEAINAYVDTQVQAVLDSFGGDARMALHYVMAMFAKAMDDLMSRSLPRPGPN